MNKKHNINLIWWLLIVGAITLAVSFKYFKVLLINQTACYTTGTIITYKDNLKTYDKIEYQYFVNKKKFVGYYYSNSLNKSLEGKKILIKYSSFLHFLSIPFYEKIIPDSINAPENGWQQIPVFNN